MDKSYVKGILQNILNSEFKPLERRRIREYPDRLNCSCFYCGDGKSDHKKRGNLYFNRLIYICFNCGIKISFDRVCKNYNQQLDPDKKMEMIEYLDKNISYKDYEVGIMETNLDKLIDFGEIDRIFNNGEYAITDFSPVQKGSNVYKYLISRGITPNLHQNIYQGKYWYNEERYDDIICLLNRGGEKILGVQIRNLKEGKRRMFKIYNFENLYKWIKNVEEIDDVDINELVIYNKISYYFNILNVDFDSEITIFEGYLDSLFYPNSLGVVGVNSDMKFLENNNLYIQYMYDNDKAGFLKSEEKIKNGYPVFLWKKLFESIVDRKSSDDPYKLMYRISKIKDLNDLAIMVENPFKKLNLDKFFSKDKFDIKYIPKNNKSYVKRSNS